MKLLVRALLFVLVMAFPSFAANYPLTIHLPIASGTSPDAGGENIQSTHRIFWAYPAVEYSIQAVVRGGVYPYTYALTAGVPAGMTINSSTGVITWTAPSVADGTAYGPITLSVTDADHTTTTSTWTVTVNATKFVFIDGDAAGGGTGTLASPYNDMGDIYNSAGAGKIVYFRSAATNYHIYGYGISHTGGGTMGCFRRQQWNTGSRSMQWVVYPGESATIDFGKALEPIHSTNVNTTNGQLTVGRWGDIWATGDYVELEARRYAQSGAAVTVDTTGTLPTGFSAGTGYYVRRVDATHVTLHPTAADATNDTNVVIPSDQGGTVDTYTVMGNAYLYVSGGADPVYLDGFTMQNGPNKMLNFINLTHYRVIRNNTFQNQYGCGAEQNSAFIMGEGNGRSPTMQQSHYVTYQNNTFHDYWDGSAVKIYAERYSVFHNNTIYNGYMVACTTSVTCPGLPGVIEGLAYKGGYMLQPTIRLNTIYNMDSDLLGGNNDALVTGEYYCNNIHGGTTDEIRINQNGTVWNNVYYYRNTFVGRINVRMTLDTTLATVAANGVAQAIGDTGPLYFSQNVIINADGALTPNYFYDNGVGGTGYGASVVATNNLTGAAADGIVDANGLLQGSYRTTWLGTRGHENCAGAITSYPVFSPTINLRRSDLDILRDDMTAFHTEQYDPRFD